MTCDLDKLFGKVVGEVPHELGLGLSFSATNLPQLPAELVTPQISVVKGIREYSGYSHLRVDFLELAATRRVFRLLGLAILAKVFHQAPREAWIHLSDPESQIHDIVLDYKPNFDRHSLVEGYYQWPDKFDYMPQEVENYGRDYWDIPNWAKPQFNLTNKENVLAGDHAWQERDVIRCAGSEYENILFANFLLNAGRSVEARKEFSLETETGFGGLAHDSVEIELYVISDTA